MQRVFIGIDDCKPGMCMAETIYNEYGAVIVAENTVLDEHLIHKITNLGILRVRVFEKYDNIITADSTEMFKAQYRENIDIIKDVLRDISNGHKIDVERVNYVAESIIVRVNENRDIIQCINQMKNADEYTYTHGVNVSLLCMLIGKWVKIDLSSMKQLVHAGLLHDVGKSRVPLEILNKPADLTREEYEEIKKHAVHGYRIVEDIPDLSEDARKGILMHHERSDGSGYPLGLKHNQINQFAKIIAVADVFDAMTSDRVYREKESPFSVFDLIENNMFGILDTRVVRAFLGNIAAYYIGDRVSLSNGEKGEIVYINPSQVSRPLIKVSDHYIDLSANKDIKIREFV